jgi:hypothetical protein
VKSEIARSTPIIRAANIKGEGASLLNSTLQQEGTNLVDDARALA